MTRLEGLSYIEKIGIKRTLGSTNMGNVIHILNNGQKYKEFGADYTDLRDSINQEYKESLLAQTSEYGNKVVSFPEIVIADTESLHGVVGIFEIGKPLMKISPLYRLSTIINTLEYMEQELDSLSTKGWNLEDIHEENILLNSRRVHRAKIIDTDFYCLQTYKDKAELYRQNIQRLFIATIDSLLPEFTQSNIYSELEDLYNLASHGIIKPSVFLKELLKRLIIKEDKNVQTLRKSI